MSRASAMALPSNIIKCMRAEDRKALRVKTIEKIAEEYDEHSEREIQATVEAWLRQRGYWPRSPDWLGGGKPERGWYIHLNETKRNPILLDLLVIGLDGRCVEIELKTATGKARAAQEYILRAGGNVHLCRGAIDAMRVIREWEESK
jgi:hypothetical protein